MDDDDRERERMCVGRNAMGGNDTLLYMMHGVCGNGKCWDVDVFVIVQN